MISRVLLWVGCFVLVLVAPRPGHAQAPSASPTQPLGPPGIDRSDPEVRRIQSRAVVALEKGIEALVASQHADGGFGFEAAGASFVEPTGWALAALGRSRPATTRRARGFLDACRVGDAWGVGPGDTEPGWATGPALLGLVRCGDQPLVARARRWLLTACLAQSAPGRPVDGWPWMPGLAPWVEPSALVVLALSTAGDGAHGRVDAACKMIQRNSAVGGGWSLYAKRPFVYHTGLVLLAFAARSPLDSGPTARAVAFLEKVPDQQLSPLDAAFRAWALVVYRSPGAVKSLHALLGGQARSGLWGGPMESAVSLLAVRQFVGLDPLVGPPGEPR